MLPTHAASLQTQRQPPLYHSQVEEDMFDEFAGLIDNDPDPSRSSLLQFFNVVCCPTLGVGLAHNQRTTVQTFLNPKYRALNRFIFELVDPAADTSNTTVKFDADAAGSTKVEMCRSRVLELLCACIHGKNAITAAKLSAKGISIQRLVYLAMSAIRNINHMNVLADENASNGSDGDGAGGGAGESEDGAGSFGGSEQDLEGFDDIDEDETSEVLREKLEVAIRTLELLSLQLQVLALNTRLFDDEDLWTLVHMLKTVLRIMVSATAPQHRAIRHHAITPSHHSLR